MVLCSHTMCEAAFKHCAVLPSLLCHCFWCYQEEKFFMASVWVWCGDVLLAARYVFLLTAFSVSATQGYSRGRSAVKTTLVCHKFLMEQTLHQPSQVLCQLLSSLLLKCLHDSVLKGRWFFFFWADISLLVSKVPWKRACFISSDTDLSKDGK